MEASQGLLTWVTNSTRREQTANRDFLIMNQGHSQSLYAQ